MFSFDEKLVEPPQETSKTCELIQTSANIKDLYLGDNYLPIEVFLTHILTRLSTRSLRGLLLTNKTCLSLLQEADVLNCLFSDPCIKNHEMMASVVKPYMHLVTQMNLSHCMRQQRGLFSYNDENFVALIKMSPNLENINFNRCKNLTNKTIYELASHCTKLTTVNLNTGDSKTDPNRLTYQGKDKRYGIRKEIPLSIY